ncbi:hypothetical protein OUZ56_026291 [Daphnia magna]|uniref:Cc8L18.2-like protein n=1 Tax=Daphnia magna TaxID=35525 RepID=A0ABQ9ZLC4_9CRUS|nr:hypothetical protein OUZ56_026291 [Daphnia magna]
MKKFSSDNTIIHCQPLVYAVLNGIEKRFSHMMQDNKLKIAAMSDPHFKLVWVEQEDLNDNITLLKGVARRLKLKSNSIVSESVIEVNDNASPKKKPRFLDGYRINNPLEIDEVDSYFADVNGDITLLNRFPTIKRIFQ